jgi:hypothetical protein
MSRRYSIRATVEDVDARREQVVLGAVAAAVLVAIVAFAASGGVKSETPSPTPAPTAPPHERDLFGGSLEPDVRYHTRAFVPALSFEVGDTEWLARDTTSADSVLLERRIRTGQPGGEYPGRSWLSFSRLPVVYDPRRDRQVAAPAELYAWMRRHPDLRVGAQHQAMVAGVPGYSFTTHVRFRRPAVFAPVCILPDVPCTAIAPNRFLLNGARMRTIVLRTSDSDPLVIDAIGVAPRDLEALEEPAASVLRSLRIGVR